METTGLRLSPLFPSFFRLGVARPSSSPEAHAASSAADLQKQVGGLATTPTGGLAARGAYWGTVRTELDGTKVAALVEAVPSITNDALRFLADGTLQVTWHLRPGLKWSDGVQLTADDLLFALQVSPDPRIVESRVAGTRDLVVRYNERVADALESITPLPRHALDAEYKRGGYEAVRTFRRTKVTPSAGPYRVTAFAVDDRLTLEANPFFSGPPPSIARVEIRRFADDAALVSAFKAERST
jgi:ABC-type transport system substrate-binding protein